MSRTAKYLLVCEALQILVTGSIIIITSIASLQAYVSYQKSLTTKRLFLEEVSRNSDQIFLFSKLSKLDLLDNLLFEMKNNYKDVSFCIKTLEASTIAANSCKDNISDYNSSSFGPDSSITVFYKISPFSNLSNTIISTLMLSMLYLLLFSFFIFKLNRKLSLVFVDSLLEIVQRVNSIGNGNRLLFSTKNQLVEIDQIETELNKLVHKLSDLEAKIENKISKKYALQVAHDIRSPVGALKMLFSIIEVNPESKGFAQLCLERIENIANDILNTQKNNLDTEPAKLENLDLNLRNIENEFILRYQLHAQFISLSVSDYPTLNIGSYNLMISDHLLSRILGILVQNTFDEFTDYSSVKVHIRASLESPTSLIISYSDNGPGFSKDILDCLNSNKKFVTNKKSLYSGHGMGLTYFVETVSRHGRINCFSNNKSGATIEFCLDLICNELNPNHITPKEPQHVDSNFS